MDEKERNRVRYERRRKSRQVFHRRRGRMNRGAWTARNPGRYSDGNRLAFGWNNCNRAMRTRATDKATLLAAVEQMRLDAIEAEAEALLEAEAEMRALEESYAATDYRWDEYGRWDADELPWTDEGDALLEALFGDAA